MTLATGEQNWNDPTYYDTMGIWPRLLLQNGPIWFEATFINPALDRMSAGAAPMDRKPNIGLAERARLTESRYLMEIELRVRENLEAFFAELRAHRKDAQYELARRRRASLDKVPLTTRRALGKFSVVLGTWALPVRYTIADSLVNALSWWCRLLIGRDMTSTLLYRLHAHGQKMTARCDRDWGELEALLFASIARYAKRAAKAIPKRQRAEGSPAQFEPRGKPYDPLPRVEQQYFAFLRFVQFLDDQVTGPREVIGNWAHERLAWLTDRVLILHGRDPSQF